MLTQTFRPETLNDEVSREVDGSLWLVSQQVLGALTLSRSAMVTFRHEPQAQHFRQHLTAGAGIAALELPGDYLYGEPLDERDTDAQIEAIEDFASEHGPKGLIIVDSSHRLGRNGEGTPSIIQALANMQDVPVTGHPLDRLPTGLAESPMTLVLAQGRRSHMLKTESFVEDYREGAPENLLRQLNNHFFVNHVGRIDAVWPEPPEAVVEPAETPAQPEAEPAIEAVEPPIREKTFDEILAQVLSGDKKHLSPQEKLTARYELHLMHLRYQKIGFKLEDF